jgi:DNA repair photolyase
VTPRVRWVLLPVLGAPLDTQKDIVYVDSAARSVLNAPASTGIGCWSLNPYVGCPHRCTFCFAVRYWVDAERGTPEEFGARQIVKLNLPMLLARELDNPRLWGEEVVVGTATDPYQPAEARYRLTRRALELLRDHANPVSILTKGPLIVRDLDVLAGLAAAAELRVYFSITTVDLSLWRTVELGTANPHNRLRAMRRLREAGVTAGVLMAPILPGITDSVASIEAVAAAAREHGAAYFQAAPLRLMAHVKDHYLTFVGQAFPALLPRYERAYPGVHASPEYREALSKRIDRICRQYGFSHEPMPRERKARPVPTRRGPQLVLPLELPPAPGPSTAAGRFRRPGRPYQTAMATRASRA